MIKWKVHEAQRRTKESNLNTPNMLMTHCEGGTYNRYIPGRTVRCKIEFTN